MRFQILDSLLNQSHGFGRRDAVTAKVLPFVIEQTDFFVNFGKIYSAIVS
jgi:regulator of sigma D